MERGLMDVMMELGSEGQKKSSQSVTKKSGATQTTGC